MSLDAALVLLEWHFTQTLLFASAFVALASESIGNAKAKYLDCKKSQLFLVWYAFSLFPCPQSVRFPWHTRMEHLSTAPRAAKKWRRF